MKRRDPVFQTYHAPNDLCGGRRLKGGEFERRKKELEARDSTRARRRRKKGGFR